MSTVNTLPQVKSEYTNLAAVSVIYKSFWATDGITITQQTVLTSDLHYLFYLT